MKKLFPPLAALLLLSCSNPEKHASYDVVPLPNDVQLTSEAPFRLTTHTVVAYPEGNEVLEKDAAFLSEYIAQSMGGSATQPYTDPQKPEKAIVLAINPTIAHAEGYVLTVTPNRITIEGQTPAGVFYGIQTLRKSLPAVAQGADVLMPTAIIRDEPRFAYRGMMLDVCRHIFPLSFVKQYIDLLALHNMNTFHWHLSDDQGWRIEIKKYPRLTEVGAMRKHTVIGKNTGVYDNTPYGGFFTQEEAKEIVRYAAERHITVIPEIDMPGHMLAAMTAYPELGCTGGPYEVAGTWGIFDDVLCLGNPKTIEFLEGVMDEITEIFPSKLIHIGGDEAPRTRWKTCPKCQAFIKSHGLKADKHHTAEDRLQSYCMTTIENYLTTKGRRIIGWDEILEGDVAPDATVMSWRGMDGGIEAANLGHDVIMAPNTYCYFDYYQSLDVKNEPFGIGGYVPLEKVYSLEPVPASLPADKKKHILGAQANLWTEYIATPEHVEYMVLPRMAALSEVQWTQPEKKEYRSFAKRTMRLMELYQRDSLNYAKLIYNTLVEVKPDPVHKSVRVTMSNVDDAPIYYTLDGSEPTQSSAHYTEPILVNTNADLRVVTIRKNEKSKEATRHLLFNKATYHPIQLLTPPSQRYTFKGAPTLVDGITGEQSYTTGEWLGFINDDPVMVIDLGEPTEFCRVSTHALIDGSNWIMGCTGLTVAISNDNQTFTQVADKAFPAETEPRKTGIEHYDIDFDPATARYIKITVKATPALPKGHPSAGSRPFIFLDEVAVE
ncbi:MAG: family 20 glycosylhydrolase [Prevotellaceae bacterium]|nr:family 20 glycosylhydrolase [Prevotellaceae bacterium]